jgi:hypothetical protein
MEKFFWREWRKISALLGRYRRRSLHIHGNMEEIIV